MVGQGVGNFDRGGDRPNRRVSARKTSFGLTTNPVSLSEIMLGAMQRGATGTGVDDTEKRSYVASTNIKALQHEAKAGYEGKAFMSMDGLFRPVSQSGDGGLPQYITPLTESGKNKGTVWENLIVYTGFSFTGSGDYNFTGPAYMHPPHMVWNTGNVTGSGGVAPPQYEIYSQVIGLNYLNPIVHPDFNHYGWQSGHDIDIIARNSGLNNGGHLSTHLERFQGRHPYTVDTRHISHRGPMIMQGWGYDLNGKPVPNFADNETDASGGIFVPTGLHDGFMSGWLEKSHTWPVAPIDLRLDRKRGLWVSPPSYSLICAKAMETIPATGSGLARMIAGPPLYNRSGTLIEYADSGGGEIGPTFPLYDVLGSAVTSGTRVIAYYDATTNEYFNLGGAGGGAGSPWIRFKLTSILTKTTANTDAEVLEAWNSAPNVSGDSVQVYNLERSTPGEYAWDGAINTVGYATYDADNIPGWRIITLDCSSSPQLASGCAHCATNTTPRSFRVIVGGVQDDTCTECPELLDGTYFLNQSGTNTCFYSATYNNGGCAPDQMTLKLESDGGGNTTAEVTLWYADSGGTDFANNIQWKKTLGASASLSCNLIDETLPYINQGGNEDCNGIPSNVRLTAV